MSSNSGLADGEGMQEILPSGGFIRFWTEASVLLATANFGKSKMSLLFGDKSSDGIKKSSALMYKGSVITIANFNINDCRGGNGKPKELPESDKNVCVWGPNNQPGQVSQVKLVRADVLLQHLALEIERFKQKKADPKKFFDELVESGAL